MRLFRDLGIVDLAGTLSGERLHLPVAKVPWFPDLNPDGSCLATYYDGDKHVIVVESGARGSASRQIPWTLPYPIT